MEVLDTKCLPNNVEAAWNGEDTRIAIAPIEIAATPGRKIMIAPINANKIPPIRR